MFLDFSLSLFYLKSKEKARNMGRATAGASQIYCVIRPDDRREESAAGRDCKERVQKIFFIQFHFDRLFIQ